MVVKGKYTTAHVFTDVVDDGAIEQIRAVCDSEVFQGIKIRVMPDVHAGAGCTIGTTMTIKDKVVPNMVGVDIGCGMEVVKLAEKEIDFARLDEFIRMNIPSGMQHRETRHSYADELDLEELKCKASVGIAKGYLSIGTLGGGNHFIEVDKDDEGALYLVVHSGSRHLGLEVAQYYQQEAKKYHANGRKEWAVLIAEMKEAGKEKEIAQTLQAAKNKLKNLSEKDLSVSYVEGKLFEDYIHDMRIMQNFAYQNRRAITDQILQGLDLKAIERFTTVHNYIDMENMILRKGAVSAQKGERLLIPINMRDGSLICIGKGNPEWNFSAPHGAGRKISRTKAREVLSMERFFEDMQGIFSTSVSEETLDESPAAYKSLEDIVNNIEPTATIEKRIYPVYNFKAGESVVKKGKK